MPFLKIIRSEGDIRMSDSRPIGVFDSGLGGLTVMRELTKVMPNEDIIYFGDTGRVPYGARSRETIIKYAKQDEGFLLSKNVKMIIAACGTVSSVAPQTGALLPVPFMEVVSHAAKAAAGLTHNHKIGVIATTATVKSNAYKTHIVDLLPDAEVFQKDCPLFVPLVESGWIDRKDPVTVNTAQRYLKPLKEQGIDVLIMGCTHYPVITDIIRDYMGADVALVNVGECTAKAAKAYIEAHCLANPNTDKATYKYFVSDHMETFSDTASILMGSNITGRVKLVNIDQFNAFV